MFNFNMFNLNMKQKIPAKGTLTLVDYSFRANYFRTCIAVENELSLIRCRYRHGVTSFI